MLEFTNYPKSVTLKDGRTLVIRPLESTDEERLSAFMNGLPPVDRVGFRDDVSNPEVIKSWVKNLDLKRVIPLVAVSGDAIVADWTLHRSNNYWTRHQATLRGSVLPDWRRVGLMRMMVSELLNIAKKLELEQVLVELFEEQRSQRHGCEELGFSAEAVLKDWVKDASGRNHTLIILSQRLEPAWREMEQMIADYGTHGG